MTGYTGYLDDRFQSHITGWAACDGKPVSATVHVNGEKVGSITPNMKRPDLQSHGISEDAGFMYALPFPLGPNDVLSVLFPDGTHLGRSPSTQHRDRVLQITDGIDARTMSGLELGALDRPMLAKRHYDVKYVDRASTEDLRTEYEEEFHSITCTTDALVDVDFVWSDGADLRSCIDREYDFVLSSHVLEHIPDVVGWLQQLWGALREGGLCNMAVPDKTRTFDHRRPTTKLAQFVECHLTRAKVPTPGQVFENAAYGCLIGTFPPINLEAGLHMAAEATKGTFVGAHCSVFTANSFLENFASLTEMGLLRYRCRKFFTTKDDANEFIVSLQKDSISSAADLALSYRANLILPQEVMQTISHTPTGRKTVALEQAIFRHVRGMTAEDVREYFARSGRDFDAMLSLAKNQIAVLGIAEEL